MFSVVVNGKEYRVVFKHRPEGTECSIQELIENEHREVCYGMAKRNPSDNPNKSIGRKVALTRALDATTTYGGKFPKTARVIFWTSYFAKLRDSRRANLVAL